LATASRFQESVIQPDFIKPVPFQHFSASTFPFIHPVHWMSAHFAVGGWSPLQRLSGMLTAHVTRIAPENGFTWHPHRGLEIYTWVLEGQLYHEDTTGGSGEIAAGELQRMFSGDWIEHQELNPWDTPARVVQIWFALERPQWSVQPHYQQLRRDQLPSRRVGDATVTELIGGASAMESHVKARLTAVTVPAGGETQLEAPRAGEDLFSYVTDGQGSAVYTDEAAALGQYDVMLASPEASGIEVRAEGDAPLHIVNFYLPPFLA
jgi:hypothetical protein